LAKIGTPLELLGWSVDEIIVLDDRGRRIKAEKWTQVDNARRQLVTDGWPQGNCHILGWRNGKLVAKGRVLMVN
jgi:hypothetical protein